MKYVYGARKLNETNADDRSEHDRASTLEFTRYDSYLFHAFSPSLSSFSTPSSSVSLHRAPSHHPSNGRREPTPLPPRIRGEASGASGSTVTL